MEEKNIGDKAQHLTDYVRAANTQLDYLKPWKADRRFQKNGGKLLYAVDTDIVKLYTDPWEKSVTQKGRIGYAQIFPDDEPELAAAIGHALANHIFFGLSGNLPLLALPPLNEEMRRVFFGIAGNAQKEQINAGKYREAFNTLKRKLEQVDKDQWIDHLSDNAPDLFKLLFDQGYNAELKRFGKLLKGAKIAPPCYLLDEEILQDQAVCQALEPVEQNVLDMIAFRELRVAWFDRLYGTKSRRPTNLLFDDAVAMARLEWINSRLDGDKYRLVMITGDQSLFEAARHHLIQGKAFSERYLRHPRGYLAEPDVLGVKGLGEPQAGKAHRRNVAEDKEPFVESLEMLASSLDEDIRPRGLLAAAKKVLKASPDLLDKFREKWKHYTHSLSARQIGDMNELEISQQIEQLLAISEDELQVLFDRKIKEAWDAFFQATTKTGHGILLYSKHSGLLPRNVPPLRFDSFEKARDFVDEVVTNGRLPKGKQSFEEDKDPYGYTYYLVYALLYAHLGDWGISKSLAAHAISLAERYDSGTISGREAYFLLAVAIRHASRSAEQLHDARLHLDLAMNLLDDEEHHNRHTDVRFDSEQIALFLTYRLYEIFLGQTIPDDIPTLKKLQVMVQNQLRDLGSENNDEIIRFATQRNLLTNLFMIVFLRVFKSRENVDKERLKPWLDMFGKNIKASSPMLSYLVTVLYKMAVWFLSDSDDKDNTRRKKKVVLDLIETNSDSKAVFVMPYDRKRFEFLKDCLKVELKP